MSDIIPFRVRPMLATLVPAPFDRPGWVYEEKYDGYRILAYKEGEKVTLLSRNAKDRTATFADLARAMRGFSDHTLLLDGEMVAFDSKGVSRFQLLQRGDVPHSFAAFDCLYRNGWDLRSQPLSARRHELEALVRPATRHILLARRLASDGLTAFQLARQAGLEGVVAKDGSAAYEERRSRKWLKVKVRQEDEFMIGGFTPPQGARKYRGALLLGAYRSRDLDYVGKVGTGFSETTLASLAQAFHPLIRDHPPFVNPPKEKAYWLEPRLVAQIAFEEWTAEGRLRQPAFLGLRDDKEPRDCVVPPDVTPS